MNLFTLVEYCQRRGHINNTNWCKRVESDDSWHYINTINKKTKTQIYSALFIFSLLYTVTHMGYDLDHQWRPYS